MLIFKREQRIVELTPEVRLGGQPGELPTVLIGTIFYSGHSVIRDPSTGEFDKGRAEVLINRAAELSDMTGNPQIIDVVGPTPETLIERIEFIADRCDAPFLVDGPSASVRIPVVKHLSEVGLLGRAVYNSIDEHTGEEEARSLREYGVKSAVLLAFHMRKVWPEDRIDVLRGFDGHKGLLELAEEAGVENKLIDTAVLDLASIGLAAKAIHLCKEEFGLPCGCGPSNATYTWRKRKTFPKQVFATCDSVTDAVTQLQGADFILYGPIEEAERAFPSCALVDALIAYTNRRYGIRPKTGNHPFYKIW
ncbi:MAG: tetrahydromethanopterin S-methyltransferase subunit H [Candidatus Bathyarchaeia archaeon]